MKTTLPLITLLAWALLLPHQAFAQPAVDVDGAIVDLVEDAAEEPAHPEPPAEESKPQDTTEPVAATPPKPAPPPGTLVFHLMDGTIITGKLQTQTIPLKTEFGDLVIPITKIQHFAPGLIAHPELNKQITGLIEQLAHSKAGQRDKAQEQLVGFGPGLAPELQRYANDKDAERRVRISKVLEEIYSNQEEYEDDDGKPTVSLARLDTIRTEHFTAAGRIQQDSFSIRSKFGALTVKLADIKAVHAPTSSKPDVRKSIEVTGKDMAGMNYKDTGIRIKRGDRITINADGKITMSPWGNNTISNPDGMANNGMYNGNIPLGALAGRIGNSGEEFLVGRKTAFTAKKSGTLYLGFAMQTNWANYQFPGSYQARVHVKPVP